ncbi:MULTISPECIES: hypothetical protein [unclassified Saccharopolyspora]|uniref:hypothetical protein n=1 Tax=unclassified Saccharopolyspora TaxID=2646250 RepID=UPI001CD2A220|nr:MULTISPECIES: hypothetical protein [unclassified Saccharopolyspora]MCA1194161.1 hypothetical protein [Saccharopolyspora sp. 6V]MCA1229940.1 hypothetical protein [Saccharopolyspora sp. 6M]
MNRYSIPARTGYEVVVGWDRPMASYFAQVYGADGEVLLDRGDALDRLNSPHHAINLVRGYVIAIPNGFADDLRALAYPLD